MRATELKGISTESLIARYLSLSLNEAILGQSAGTVARSLQCYATRL